MGVFQGSAKGCAGRLVMSNRLAVSISRLDLVAFLQPSQEPVQDVETFIYGHG